MLRLLADKTYEFPLIQPSKGETDYTVLVYIEDSCECWDLMVDEFNDAQKPRKVAKGVAQVKAYYAAIGELELVIDMKLMRRSALQASDRSKAELDIALERYSSPEQYIV